MHQKKHVINLQFSCPWLSDEELVNEASAGYLSTRLQVCKFPTLLPGNPFPPAFPFAP